MNAKRRKSDLRVTRRRFALEALEPRVVLDGQLGVEVAGVVADEQSHFEKFESAVEMQEFLVAKAVDQWKDLFGTETQRWPYIPHLLEHGVIPRLAQTDSLTTAGASFDSTNIQVAGVDEADLVKTDGEYLYIANDSRLTIVDARDATNLTVAAEIPLDSYSAELFVSGDRLAVLSHELGIIAYADAHAAEGRLDTTFASYEHFPPTTSIAIYDISDPTTPKLVSDTTIDGHLTASRRIDDFVYLVTSNSLNLPQLDMHCKEVDSGADESPQVSTVAGDRLIVRPYPWPDKSHDCIYETKDEYLARVEDDILEMSLASYQVTNGNGEAIADGLVTDPTDTYKPLVDNAFNLTSVVVVDLTSEAGGIADSTSIMTGYGSTVYASDDNIYVASASYADEVTTTTLQQFAISDDGLSVDLQAVGSVPGTLLNQFAMDEHDGYLRVVTSEGWGENRTNRLFVLDAVANDLHVVGSIDEIATGESVFAVRFMGDEAFVVTFRVIDPLFTIDLSDPTNPTIEGELEIPGFSNYMHPISEDLLIGLGRDDGGWGGTPQLSLFDVYDFTNPERLDKFRFERTNWSEAFYNHHAINYFADQQIAVIPFYASYHRCDSREECEQPKNAFWVLQIDTAGEVKSIQSLGKIEVDESPLRSVRIEDTLFAISTSEVQAVELLDPSTIIDSLYIGRIVLPDFVSVDGLDGETTIDVLANDHVGDEAVIAEVSEPTSGGTAKIADDGKSIVYSPPSDQTVRHERFTYEVEVAGVRKTATVRVNIQRENARNRMIRLAKQDLTERFDLGADDGQAFLASAEYVEWSDSCLGLADDGEVCAQVVTPGYKIVFEHALARIVYHTDTTERVLLANDPVISTEALIGLTAEIVDSAGEPTRSLFVGERGTLKVSANDLRNDPLGVFAAYFDIRFNASLVEEIGRIGHGKDFINGQSGRLSEPGLFDEVGGFTTEPSPDMTHVVSIPFVAGAVGELQFTLNPPDILPDSDLLLMGVDVPIPQHLIDFGSINIEIVDGMQNKSNPTDTNMDGTMSALDVLLVVNHLNSHGAGPISGEAATAIRAAALDANARMFSLDVNGDGSVSPIDALIIINAMRANEGISPEGEATPLDVTREATESVAPPIYVTAPVNALRHNPARVIEVPDLAAYEAEQIVRSIDLISQSVARQVDVAVDAHAEDDFFAALAIADEFDTDSN